MENREEYDNNGIEKIKKKRGRPPKNSVSTSTASPKRKRSTTSLAAKKRAYNKWGLEEMGEEFLRVCQFGQTDTARVMLRKGAPVNAQDKLSKNSGLHEAAGMGYGELVKVLLKRPEINVTLNNIHDETPLQVATDPMIKELLQEEIEFRNNLTGQRSDLRRQILQKETEKIFSQDDLFVLRLAVKLNIPRILEEYHLLHPQDKFETLLEERRTLLHEACRWSSPEAVQCLLDYGADVFALDSANKLPSEYVATQCKDLRKIFRKYARKHEIEDERVMLPPTQRSLSPEDTEDEDINMDDEDNHPRQTFVTSSKEPPRMPVTLSREERKLQQLLGILERADSGNALTPTGPAMVKRGPGRPRKNSLTSPRTVESNGTLSTQQRPLKQPKRKLKVKERIGDEVFVIPQDPDDGIFNPNKPRDYKKGKKHKRKLHKRKSSTSSVTFTAGSGFDPLIRDKATQRTLLHKAASRNNLEKAKELVAKAPELANMQDNGRYLALHEAALRGHVEMVEFLLESGSNVNCGAENGDTPLHDASENGHLDVVKILMDKGADVTCKNKQGLTPVDVSYAEVYEHFTSLGYSRVEREPAEENDHSFEERRPRKSPIESVEVEKIVKRKKKRHVVVNEKKIKPEKKLKKVKKAVSEEYSSPTLPSDESGKENNISKTITAPEKIYLVNHQSTWHFLSKQIESFYENSLNVRGFRENNQQIYKGIHVTLEDYTRVTKATFSSISNSEDVFSCELLEKEAVYAVFRRDGVPLGSIPVVFSDAALNLTSLSVADGNSKQRKTSNLLPPKMRMKLNATPNSSA